MSRNSREAKAARRAKRQPGTDPVVRELHVLALHAAEVPVPGSVLFADYVGRVLETGRSYPNGYSLAELDTVDRCFTNAQRLARERGWRYVEGLATEPAVPGRYREGWIEHAWNLDESGTVVECTYAHWPQRRYFGTVTELPAGEPGISPVFRDARLSR